MNDLIDMLLIYDMCLFPEVVCFTQGSGHWVGKGNEREFLEGKKEPWGDGGGAAQGVGLGIGRGSSDDHDFNYHQKIWQDNDNNNCHYEFPPLVELMLEGRPSILSKRDDEDAEKIAKLIWDDAHD